MRLKTQAHAVFTTVSTLLEVVRLRARFLLSEAANRLPKLICHNDAPVAIVNIRRSAFILLALGAILSGTGRAAHAQGIGSSGPLLAQGALAAPVIDARTVGPSPGTGTTILPTDVLPLPTIQNRMTFGENLQLRVLQKLPARFFFSGSVESTWRYETNVYQFPKKSIFVRQLAQDPTTKAYSLARLNALMPPDPITLQEATQWRQISNTLAEVDREDRIFRVLPSINAGFQITPHTQVQLNYFMIRDSLWDNTRLNTTIQSIAYGVQHQIPFANGRGNLQMQVQARSLWQPHQDPLFDFLPNLQVNYTVNPRTYAYVSALAQLRSKAYFQAPHREMDPFYTWGMLHVRGRWAFSASTTFVQNFRQPFGADASIRANNYSFISDFEVDRSLFRQIPGLQMVIRAEPIWNIEKNNRPGLAGMDFRLYTGLRMSVSKPALTVALDSLRRQLEEQEIQPPSAPQTEPGSGGGKPSAFIQPHQVVASTPQPIHGFMTDTGAPDDIANAAAGDLVPVKLETPAQQIADQEETTTAL